MDYKQLSTDSLMDRYTELMAIRRNTPESMDELDSIIKELDRREELDKLPEGYVKIRPDLARTYQKMNVKDSDGTKISLTQFVNDTLHDNIILWYQYKSLLDRPKNRRLGGRNERIEGLDRQRVDEESADTL